MSNATFDFSGRVVMVTGANGNLGKAVAQAFAAAGAALILVGREQERVRAALPSLSSEDSAWLAPSTDLKDVATTNQMVSAAVERFGQLDVLANTVGGYRAGEPVHETDIATWDFMMALNARTAFVISQSVVPYMLARASGAIIHTASRAAYSGSAKAAAYSASKSALIRLTESLAAEMKTKGIHVNCVVPGTIDTPDNRSAMPNADHSRWVPPEVIAQVFLFLASDAAQAIHGASIPVDGLS
jgi:NAD(P)-dependent dehydrogenase (short-subunit alcohol dehydrogenase family)